MVCRGQGLVHFIRRRIQALEDQKLPMPGQCHGVAKEALNYADRMVLECRNPDIFLDDGKASAPACGSTSEGRGRAKEGSLEDKEAAECCLEILTYKDKKPVKG